MSIKEEFEKVYEKESNKRVGWDEWEIALWSAKWMAERLCQDFPYHSGAYTGINIQKKLRQLAKEL